VADGDLPKSWNISRTHQAHGPNKRAGYQRLDAWGGEKVCTKRNLDTRPQLGSPVKPTYNLVKYSLDSRDVRTGRGEDPDAHARRITCRQD
jgi:hypothetical protein